MRQWEIYQGRKKSIMMKAFPELKEQDSYYWTWNKKWLDGFLKNKLITNLEYLEGLELLEKVKGK